MRMISRDVTRPVLLLVVLCWVAAGSMGPNRDEKTVKSSEKCLHELDCPDEPQNPQFAEPPVEPGSGNNHTDKRMIQTIGRIVRSASKYVSIFGNPKDLQVVGKDTVASIYNTRDKYSVATFAFFEYEKGMKGLSEKDFSNDFHQHPDLEKSVQPRSQWFVNTGFDRGHMLPRQLLKYGSTDVLYEICSFPYIIPQVSGLNRVNWRQMEDKADKKMKTLAATHGKLYVFIMTLTSDKFFSVKQSQLVYTTQKMKFLKGKTGQVPIPNSLGQVVVYFKRNSETGKLEVIDRLAYIGNNIDSVQLTAQVTVEDFCKWAGIKKKEFEQIIVDQQNEIRY